MFLSTYQRQAFLISPLCHRNAILTSLLYRLHSSFTFTVQSYSNCIIAYCIFNYHSLTTSLKIYQNKREKFIDKVSEDEYNYKNSAKFQDSRLLRLLFINVLALLLIIYTLYCFYFLHLDLIYTNIIIALLSLGTTLLVQPVLKDKYAVYSHKLGKIYWNLTLIKMFLPMITIPFAFAGFTDFLNSIFSISIPPYELGTKEFIINAVLYILIYCSPFIKENFV